MHNDIMAAGSRERPPMLATGRYAQWQSRFLRYVDTKPNKKELRQCIFDGPCYQNEVNDIRAEKLARNANPLTLVAATQQGKEIAKPITPPSESSSEEDKDSDSEQAQRDKDIHINDNQTGQFGNQRTVTIGGARETIENQIVQQTEIQCFNYKEFRNFANECKESKWAKDYAYHKEKMMLCKQEEKGVPLSTEQCDWLNDTDDKLDEQEFEAHYMYMAKIQEVSTVDSGPTFDAKPLEQVQSNDDYNVFANKRQHFEQSKTINDTYVVETVDSNVIPNSSNMCDNEEHAGQNAEEYKDERVVLANLIANLKLDHDENKKRLKQLKKANASLTHE
uniref:Integrase, catalytic region, zinc finger, CCHC-type, peptidase aspartic, catalytic n=1 Tax=Tanacetum cinerariifolium TaxID=118510 RepID=A0A699KHV0_TANCI|nr:hypothetical protein [Tanacetum cinerariifolium]